MTASAVVELVDFLAASRRLFVLTGAGVSTASGIPDYRDAAGAWKRPQPMTGQAFRDSVARRRRYWAGSMIGWPTFAAAQPASAHSALARLEASGRLHMLVTQNVDRLHQRAGSRRAIDLHGRLDRLRCLDCGGRYSRSAFQRRLSAANPEWIAAQADLAPDGDADVVTDRRRFHVPACRRCGGPLKPDVVFFGEAVPGRRVARARNALLAADAVLVVGSSLMVWSGYRFVRAAVAAGLPVAAVNIGRTRADALLSFKLRSDCGAALEAAVSDLPPVADQFARGCRGALSSSGR